ncbi:V-type sodium ATPase catalytic subunit A [BD1-7 clade bacterium]|uniref:V-type ATP synthase alpha chain n=1 Tax=BD1-7 clade bacterium TaxID=2029982 RepID=A0A5S9QHS3_9GAMM|nr:V-type sodium ATPase catalytic subunit A [BD1-7 clade bacterium]CAA0117138.1 V-type sodium ATPase catalytic subunit A [BD1-7 clade bacterium]
MSDIQATARVVAIKDEVITIESVFDESHEHLTPLVKNEVVYICPQSVTGKSYQERLKAEVLRVKGRTADVQVFEDTRGVCVGDPVEQSGEMLSVELGPGLLGKVYDGLQNPLKRLEADHGRFMARGVDIEALQRQQKWAFSSVARVGDRLRAGDVLGTVQEGRYTHNIMIPFDEPGEVEVLWIQEGTFTVETIVAKICDEGGKERGLNLIQRWPVKRPLPHQLFRRNLSKREYPREPLTTTLRLIDTFFPIAKGGTGCIPGPFGAGKTVLQHLISRYSDVDIVIVVACGERAGEVVETITEFPQLNDPRTGGTLMDRTIIICNTSSMPVASREASIYTGVTLGEYYRQMGYNVLVLADSTSRWAQAMRETSGRLEEIPGEEAFPAYLESTIKNLYERAGLVTNNDGVEGSLTIIGTVSPAGGNFEEPVTQATLGTVKTFLGLSYDRAYKRFYPAVDPLISWSRYLEQIEPWFSANMGKDWTTKIERLANLLEKGSSVHSMMQVTGEEGVTLDDYVTYHQSLFLDMVYLQQDAFDDIDVSTPLDRQRRSIDLISDLLERQQSYTSKDEVRKYFTRLTDLFKNLNYSADKTDEYNRYLNQLRALGIDETEGESDAKAAGAGG